MGHHRDAGGSQGRDLIGDPLAALELDRVGAGLLEEAGRGREGLSGARLVAAERQVGHHQRVLGAAHHAADQRDQLVGRDRHGGVVAVDHVGGGITDQQHRDARLVEGARGRVVVDREHGPLVAFGLPLLKVMRAHLGASNRGRATAAIDSLFRHRCPQ